MPSKDQEVHTGQERATTFVKVTTRREEPPSPPSSDISMDSSSSIDVVMHSPEKAASASLPLAVLGLKVPFYSKGIVWCSFVCTAVAHHLRVWRPIYALDLFLVIGLSRK